MLTAGDLSFNISLLCELNPPCDSELSWTGDPPNDPGEYPKNKNNNLPHFYNLPHDKSKLHRLIILYLCEGDNYCVP